MKYELTTTRKAVFCATFLLVILLALPLFALAQDHQHHNGGNEVIGKKGQIHFTSNVKVGDTLLKAGMYQVQHLAEGGDHVIIFKEMAMAAGYKMGNTPVGKEVVRIKCKIEPVTKAVNNTKITLRTNAKGEKEVADIQVAGEAVKHLL